MRPGDDAVTARIDIDAPEVDMDYGQRLLYGGKLFTGEAGRPTRSWRLDTWLAAGDLPDVFRRFQRWAVSDPKDIGLQTEDVLTNGERRDRADSVHFQVNPRAAGNGALMRAATSAVYFARQRREASMDAGRRLSALPHGDPAAWEGTAVLHAVWRSWGNSPRRAVRCAGFGDMRLRRAGRPRQRLRPAQKAGRGPCGAMTSITS